MAIAPTHPVVPRLKSEFLKLGYSFESFRLDGKAYTRFVAPHGGSWLTRDARVNYPFFDMASRIIADNKHLSNELCQKNGIAIPKTIFFEDANKVRDELDELLNGGAIVIKPSNARLSWGVTINIDTVHKMTHAIKKAKQFDSVIIAQRHVGGEEVRFAVLNGEVKVALLRQTARIIGDGDSTVAQLLDEENKTRQSLSFKYSRYPPLDEKIIDLSQFDVNSVPAAGAIVELSSSTMVRGGASIFNVLDNIHDSYIQIAKNAVVAIGASFTVVDIMIEDMTKPADNSNYAFIEYNSAPALGLFYSCRDGKQYDMLPELAYLIDAQIRARAV